MFNKRNAIFLGILTLLTIFAILSFAEESPPIKKKSSEILEVRSGLLAHDVDRLWSGSREESGADVNVEILFARPMGSPGAGIVRPSIGVSVNNRNQTSKLYAGALWELRHSSGAFLELGLGLAVHDGIRIAGDKGKKPLGSRVLFRVPIELGVVFHRRHRLSLAFDHISNAYLAKPNRGMDTLGLRYGYIF